VRCLSRIRSQLIGIPARGQFVQFSRFDVEAVFARTEGSVDDLDAALALFVQSIEPVFTSAESQLDCWASRPVWWP